ncbi:MAG: prenyltransferase [Chloroflexota bacterium]
MTAPLSARSAARGGADLSARGTSPSSGTDAVAITRELLTASRPFSWINTALPFLAAAFGASGRLDAAVVAGFLYFLFPYNLLMYGVNDLYDYASDIRNPRKASIEGAIVPPTSGRRLWVAVLGTNVPFLVLIGVVAGPVAGAACAITALTAWLYSAPPLRTKERPFLDSLTSALHFALPAVCGFLVAGVALTAVPWAVVVAFVAWGVASHALGAIQDIAYDRAAGIGSIATALGARPTAWVALAGYVLAVAVTATVGGAAGLFAAAWLALYLLLPPLVLVRPDEAQARRAWRGFLGLNLLVGFMLTQLLRAWGVTTFTATELLVGLGAGAALVVLLMVASTWLLTRRAPLAVRVAAGPDAPALRPRVTILLPCRDEAERLPAALDAALTQHGTPVRILVVDDASTDATAALARARLGERGEVIAAPPLPGGWTGKAWAVQTGIAHATTELVLVVDADTVLAPEAAATLVAEADRQGADLVSGVTAYAMPTRTERALMPGFPLLLFGFLPLGLLARTGGRPASMAFGYGPLTLVRRSAYLALGGHAPIAGSTREDVELPRRFARVGRRVTIVHAADLAATRHYATARQIALAWRRYLVAYAGESIAVALTAILGFTLAWVLPMALPIAGLLTGDAPLLAGGLAALGIMALARALLAVSQREPLATVAWHPVTAPATVILLLAGLLADAYGAPRTWRGRTLPTTAAPSIPGPPAGNPSPGTSVPAPATKGQP